MIQYYLENNETVIFCTSTSSCERMQPALRKFLFILGTFYSFMATFQDLPSASDNFECSEYKPEFRKIKSSDHQFDSLQLLPMLKHQSQIRQMNICLQYFLQLQLTVLQMYWAFQVFPFLTPTQRLSQCPSLDTLPWVLRGIGLIPYMVLQNKTRYNTRFVCTSN